LTGTGTIDRGKVVVVCLVLRLWLLSLFPEEFSIASKGFRCKRNISFNYFIVAG